VQTVEDLHVESEKEMQQKREKAQAQKTEESVIASTA
jgi:hypothetical protein